MLLHLKLLKMSKTIQVLIALILGLVLGILTSVSENSILKSFVEIGTPIGKLWVNGIRMTVIPLVVSLLITGIASTTFQKFGQIGSKAILWFLLLVSGSSTLTAFLAPTLLELGNIDSDISKTHSDSVINTGVDLPLFSDWIVDLIPPNPISAAAEGAMLPLIIFTIIFGVSITKLDENPRQRLITFFDAIAKSMLIIVEWILYVAPIGVFFLVLPLAANAGVDLVFAMGWFLIVACGLIVLSILILYPLTSYFSKVSIKDFALACAPAQAIGFSTRSSLASLPAMIEAADQKLKLPVEISGVVLPVAVALLKFASPIARGTGTIFVAYLYGIDLSTFEIITIMAAIGALSFYSPGVPSGGLFIMTPVYLSLGLPVEGIGLLIALDLIPDMFITLANVTADMSVATILGSKK